MTTRQGDGEARTELDAGVAAPGDARAEVRWAHAAGPAPLPAAVGSNGASLSDRSSAAEVIGTHLRAQARRMLGAEADVRADEYDAVHQMRVATRRLRSALRTFGPLFDEEPASQLEAELEWLASLLGDVRDHEVLRERLDAQVDALPPEQVLGPVRARLDERLAAETAAASRALLEGLDGERYAALVTALVTFAQDPPFTQEAGERATAVLPRMVRAEDKRLARRVRRLESSSPGNDPDAAFHAVRKQAKRARYAAEVVTPAFGRRAARYAKAAERVQDLLGDRQDAVVAAELLREEGARAGVVPGENGYTFGLLAGMEQARIAGDDDEFARLWRKVDRRKRRRWMS